MNKYAAAIFGFLLFPEALLNAKEIPSAAAIKALHAANPAVAWDAKTIKVADVTCDGIPDTLLIGYEKGSVWVGLVPGTPSGKVGLPMTTHLFVGKHSQDSFCSVPVKISVSPINCDGESGPLPGCKAVKGCSEFDLSDDSCDPFYFYWDNSQKMLTWWRN